MSKIPITSIKGVGPKNAEYLRQLGITTIDDLVWYFPRKYDDYTMASKIADIRPGKVSIKAHITSVSARYSRKGLHMTSAVAEDSSGKVALVWFNQPYRAASIKPGVDYHIAGELSLRSGRLNIANPAVEQAESKGINTGAIVPIYRESKHLTSRFIREIMYSALERYHCEESLPGWLLNKYSLISLKDAQQLLHFPKSADDLSKAKRRIAFEEVLSLVIAAELNRQQNNTTPAKEIPFNESAARHFVSTLPFTLSADQKRAVWQIYNEISTTVPMNRLVEGDVGSGKTVVAAMAALMALEAGFQVALMAPTEILARQHFATLKTILSYSKHQDDIHLLVGALKSTEKSLVHQTISSQAKGLYIGTQALLSNNVTFPRLGLIIIDEQHRFGVEQRRLLQKRLGYMPHILTMTATPIPRTLALTIYGELSISQIHTKPKGRLPITTELFTGDGRVEVYRRAEAQLNDDRQLYVVCPLIEESDVLRVRSVTEVYNDISKKYLKDWRVGLLHGKMKSKEKEEVMLKFQRHELDVLVSTTVIEVGVDVPNATTIIIEGAERFGLAQLHQLRGRVGRSDLQSYCYAITSSNDQPSKRLRAFATSQDGFRLAELDLELRGPGALYGLRQSGELDLKIANLSDITLIQEVRRAAKEFIEMKEDMLHYPQLYSYIKKAQIINHFN